MDRATTLLAGVDGMELRQIERTLRLRIDRKQLNTSGKNQPGGLFKTPLRRGR
jgi:hypothetical protein